MGPRRAQIALEHYVYDRMWLDGPCVRVAVMFEGWTWAEEFARLLPDRSFDPSVTERTVTFRSCEGDPITEPDRHGPGQLLPLYATLEAATDRVTPRRERCAIEAAHAEMPTVSAQPSAAELATFWTWLDEFESDC